MVLEYDPESGASYLVIRREPVARTISMSDLVMVDLGADGQAVGIEWLTE